MTDHQSDDLNYSARKKLEALAARAKSPVLCFDAAALQVFMKNVNRLGERYGTYFLSPVKAFPHPQMWKWVNKHLAGFDVSNSAELKTVLGLRARFYSLDWKSQIVNSSDVSKMSGLRESQFLLSTDSHPVFQANQHIPFLRLGLRIDPCSVLPNSTTRKDHDSSRFGLSAKEARSFLKTHRPGKTGLHFHYASGSNRFEDYVLMAKSAIQLTREAKVSLDFLNLGGGLASFELPDLEKLLKSLRKIVPSKTDLIFEPGRFFSERFGYALARVESVQSGSTTLDCRLNLSRECHMRWGRPKPFSIPPIVFKKGKRKVSFTGPTSVESDIILRMSLEDATFELEPGDPFIFKNIPGYCVAWNHGFNGTPPAKIEFF